MAYASVSDRLALIGNSTLGLQNCPFVVRFEKAGRQSELVADDIDHALTLQAHWIERGSDYVEIFRVLPNGEINPTIGAFWKEAA